MRRLERSLSAPAANTLASTLTVPADHKYEVIDFSSQNDGAHQYTWLLLALVSGTYYALDELDIAPPQLFGHHMYAGLVLEAGDQLILFASTAGSAAVGAVVGYVDVSPI